MRAAALLALPKQVQLPPRGKGGVGACSARAQGPAWVPPLRAGWEVPPQDVKISRAADGEEWLLAQGRSSRVYRGIRGGVQVRCAVMLCASRAHAVMGAGVLRCACSTAGAAVVVWQ